jgi:thiol-disulfide isomerase/thioredoxin
VRIVATATAAGLACAALLAAGCKVDEPAPTKMVEAPAKSAEAPPRPAMAVELIEAPGGEVAPTVQRELARARADGRRLLVYVGARWCEPCRYFHEAAAAGQLDAIFPGLRLVEFDLDRDKDALEKAGYASRMIPLFALPREDGTGSGEQIEGSIKGPGAVAQIRPRLEALLARGR